MPVYYLHFAILYFAANRCAGSPYATAVRTCSLPTAQGCHLFVPCAESMEELGMQLHALVGAGIGACTEWL